MKSKSFIPLEVRKRKGKMKVLRISMVKRPTLIGTRTDGNGLMAPPISLITPLSLRGTRSLIGLHVSHGRRRNGKDTSPATIGFVGPKYGTHNSPVKKRHSFGQYGTKRWRSMSGGPTLRWYPFPNNAPFAYQILVNRLNTNFGIVFKLGGCGDGPHSSCMRSVGLELATMIVLIVNKHFFWERLPKKYGKKAKIWHLLRGITMWIIWIERNDKVFNHEQWHKSKVKRRLWDELIIYAKRAWAHVIKLIKISNFSAVAMLQGFDRTWGARNVLCRQNNLHIEWNWKRRCR